MKAAKRKRETKIACWGDSLTAGAGAGAGNSYPDVLAQLSGFAVYNGGINGDRSFQIAARVRADSAHRNDVVVIWAGRNNWQDSAAVLADVAGMVSELAPPRRFLVLSVLNAGYAGVGSFEYRDIAALNQALQAAYPRNYLDIRSLLVARYDPSKPHDVIDHGQDVPPSRLRFDDVHLNSAGYALVAEEVLARLRADGHV